MKRKGKVWFFVSLILIVFITLTSVFGFQDKFGDIYTPIIRPAHETQQGIDIQGGIEIAFSSANGAKPSDEDRDAMLQVLQKRVNALGITSPQFKYGVSTGDMVLVVPGGLQTDTVIPEEAAEVMLATGRLEVRQGNEIKDGKPSGVTAENVLLSSDDISSSQMQTTTDSDGDLVGYIALSVDAEALTAAAKAADAFNTDGEGQISFWLDGKCISVQSVDETFLSNGILLGGGETKISAIDATNINAILNSGQMPYKLQLDSITYISADATGRFQQADFWATWTAVALVMLCMVLLYRVAGVAAALAVLGQAAGTAAFFSSFFSVFPSMLITQPGGILMTVSIGLGAVSSILTIESIREEMTAGKKFDTAIRQGMDNTRKLVITINVLVILLGAAIMGFFGPPSSFFCRIFYPLLFALPATTSYTAYNFGHVLLASGFANLIFGVFLLRVMLRSLSRFSFLRKPFLFAAPRGGKPVETPQGKFVARRKVWYTIGVLVTVASIALCFVFSASLDTTMTGGTSMTFSYSGKLDLADMQEDAADVLGGSALVSQGTPLPDGTSTFSIQIVGGKVMTREREAAFSKLLRENYADNLITRTSLSTAPASGSIMTNVKFGVCTLIAVLILLFFVAARFSGMHGWSKAFITLVASLPAAASVPAVFAAFGVPLGALALACMMFALVIAGTGSNILFARMRENRALYGKNLYASEMMDLSINQLRRRWGIVFASAGTAAVVALIFSAVYALPLALAVSATILAVLVLAPLGTVFLAGPLAVKRESKGEKKRPASKAAAKKAEDKKAVAKNSKDDDKEAEDDEAEEDADDKNDKDDKKEQEDKVSGKKSRKFGKKNKPDDEEDESDNEDESSQEAESKADSEEEPDESDEEPVPVKPAKGGKKASVKKASAKAVAAKEEAVAEEPTLQTEDAAEPSDEETAEPAKAEKKTASAAKPAAKKQPAKANDKKAVKADDDDVAEDDEALDTEASAD